MSVKTDPASAEIPSAEVFVPAAILDPDFPGLRAAPGQPLSCVQSVLSGQPDPSGSSVPCAQSVPCDQSVPGDISVASGQPVTPGLPAVSVRPVSPAQGAIAGRPAVSGYGAVCTDGAGPSGALPSVAGVPPSFGAFALAVYPFLELQPFHRAYYRVLEAFAAGRIRRLIVTMPPQHGKAALSMIETGKAGLSARNRNILVQELNVNPEWLESGKGNMFNAEPDLTAYMHRTDNSLPLQSVPLYSIEGTAGLVPLFADQAQAKPVNFIHIPNLPKCDGAIYIVGDSMYPLLKSGDIVLYKQLGDINDIFWGDMYLLSIDIDGEEYVTVKYIQKSDREGYVKLVSQNPHHADKDVAINRIRAIALVKASIRMNSIR